MELNTVETNHHHASVSLKVLLLIFAVVLIGALSYFIYLQNEAVEEVDNIATTPTTKTDSAQSIAPNIYKTTADAGNFEFELPDGWGVYHYFGCEGGCLYFFNIGKVDTEQKVIALAENVPVITISSRKLSAGATLADYNSAENLGELTEIGNITVAEVAGKEYSVDGLSNIYYARFVRGDMGYSLMVSGNSEISSLKSNVIVKGILESWKFN